MDSEEVKTTQSEEKPKATKTEGKMAFAFPEHDTVVYSDTIENARKQLDAILSSKK